MVGICFVEEHNPNPSQEGDFVVDIYWVLMTIIFYVSFNLLFSKLFDFSSGLFPS